ncbi:MAG: desulfoferrodoxin [Dehalococcoidia bacterium]
MPSQVGKRYSCSQCGSEFIVTRGGEGELTCCDKPVEQKK